VNDFFQKVEGLRVKCREICKKYVVTGDSKSAILEIKKVVGLDATVCFSVPPYDSLNAPMQMFAGSINWEGKILNF
jgi:hypothetical protein